MFAGSIMIAKLLADLNKKIAFCTGAAASPGYDRASALPRRANLKFAREEPWII